MNVIKKILCYFDKIYGEIKRINIKACLISSAVFFVLGIFSWIIGGRTDKVRILYIFPRSALPIVYEFILWGVAFMFLGFIFGGILFGCERYKRQFASKISLFIIISFIFTLCVYPVFFGALSPIFSFVLLLISLMFCALAILSSFKLYSLWTVCLTLYFLWLIYNLYVSLAFTFVNWNYRGKIWKEKLYLIY